MENFVKDLLGVLKEYFIYIYPGIISLFIFRFANGKKFVEDKISLLKSIVISYVYVILLSIFIKIDFENVSKKIHIILLIMSVVLPVFIHAAGNWNWVRKILMFCSINTSLRDNVLDTITSLENDKNKGISVKLFLDEKGLMYEGKLRLHESDSSCEKILAISQYRRYVKENERYSVKQDYSGDNSRWVVLREKDVTRIEIKYEDEK